MTDFWRIANVVAVAVVVVLAVWFSVNRGKKRLKQTTAGPEPAKLDELLKRKQKLASDLKNYEDDVNRLEHEARQMVDEYFARQQACISDMVKEETRAVLNEMEAEAKAAVQAGFETAKDRLQKNFDDR